MAYYPKKPRFTHEDVVREIYNRTGIPINGVFQVLGALNEIIKESILAGVEVPLGEIGFLSWSIKVPRKHCRCFNIHTGEIWYKDFPGCCTPTMRWNKKWQDELKDATRYEDEDGKNA